MEMENHHYGEDKDDIVLSSLNIRLGKKYLL